MKTKMSTLFLVTSILIIILGTSCEKEPEVRPVPPTGYKFYPITIVSGDNGEVTTNPLEISRVKAGDSVTFNVVAAKNYIISSIILNGNQKDIKNLLQMSVTVDKVTSPLDIQVSFVINDTAIMLTNGEWHEHLNEELYNGKWYEMIPDDSSFDGLISVYRMDGILWVYKADGTLIGGPYEWNLTTNNGLLVPGFNYTIKTLNNDSLIVEYSGSSYGKTYFYRNTYTHFKKEGY